MSDKQHPEQTVVGGVVYVSKFHADRMLSEARQDIREREVKPLIAACNTAQKIWSAHNDRLRCIDDTLVAVEKAQKEQP